MLLVKLLLLPLVMRLHFLWLLRFPLSFFLLMLLFVASGAVCGAGLLLRLVRFVELWLCDSSCRLGAWRQRAARE